MFYGTGVSLEGHVAVLTITNLQEDDFLTYTLVITNDIGTTESNFILGVESNNFFVTCLNPTARFSLRLCTLYVSEKGAGYNPIKVTKIKLKTWFYTKRTVIIVCLHLI